MFWFSPPWLLDDPNHLDPCNLLLFENTEFYVLFFLQEITSWGVKTSARDYCRTLQSKFGRSLGSRPPSLRTFTISGRLWNRPRSTSPSSPASLSGCRCTFRRTAALAVKALAPPRSSSRLRSRDRCLRRSTRTFSRKF